MMDVGDIRTLGRWLQIADYDFVKERWREIARLES